MIPRLPPSFFSRPIAHRGLHDVNDGRPENSMAAAQAAIDEGYGIELDVQISSDGQPMAFHDYALERLSNGRGAIRQHTARDLAQLRLTGSDEGIPTLPEFLEVVDGQVPLLIEIKDQDGALGQNVGRLEQLTATALDNYSGDAALMSFNPYSVRCFQTLAPERPRGLVTEAFPPDEWPVPEARLQKLRGIPDYDNVGASFVSHKATDLGSVRVAELKARGANILCWTIKSPEEEAEARKIADNITFEGYLA